ncbi:MAG: hypothetical protein KKG99_16780 [Bacteroidetes bacterium]|nr:hypothetical protein [Bacteroidota bacterium]
MMKKLSLFMGLAILITACSTNKEISQINQMRTKGISSFTEGDYSGAFAKFAELINVAESKGELARLEDYEGAGKSAYALGQNERALVYLEQAKDLGSKDENVYFSLADIYHIKDNLSKEIRYLEFYNTNYPKGSHIKLVDLRLFESYVKSENWEQGLAQWPLVQDNQPFLEIIAEGYFKINKALKNEAECEKTAKELLKINSNNIIALEWSAERLFWKAENFYQESITEYDKKKTNSQYAKLLKALNVVTADFKKSRDLFEKLYKLKPLPKYAHFLGNIYSRLNDKEKAKYYQSKAD